MKLLGVVGVICGLSWQNLSAAPSPTKDLRWKAISAKISASSSSADHLPNEALDGQPSSYWQASELGDAWLDLTFGELTHLSSISFTDPVATTGTYTILAGLDNKSWRPVASFENRQPQERTIDAVGVLFRIVVHPQRVGETVALARLSYQAEAATKAESVNIFMGTNNDGSHFSRGNQYPGVHTPFGMNAWSVGSGDLNNSWFYDFKDTVVTGIKLTHQPTVWGGDYAALDFMPMTESVSADYVGRASAFRRANEVATPYYYQNTLDRYGISFAFVPSDRGAIFQFHYPDGRTPYLAIGGISTLPQTLVQRDDRTLSGRLFNGEVDIFFSIEFDRPMLSVVTAPGMVAGIKFAPNQLGGHEPVTMKVATSYISQQQASDNLFLELRNHTIESLKIETKDKWEASLGKIEVSGPNAGDRMTFYSALYRVFAFPKMHWEPIGRDATAFQYFSPFDHQVHRNKKLWTGNGFWDSYRGVWPLLSILFPDMVGEMLDGFVDSYRDGGWTVRWSKPGYWNCMIGTHTDIIFADAFTKGIRNWDYLQGYQASLKNALVAGAPGGRGRRFLERSSFLGYAPWNYSSINDEVGAQTMEDSINDFGISQFAKALGKEGDYLYFKNRALGYANLWSPSAKFFRGKDDQGLWYSSDTEFDPYAWRYEWTEGNAWHYRMAPMHDGAGLVGLFGGRNNLEQGLDEILAASPHFAVGGYGTVIHEMAEAQYIGQKGFGQLAIGNEPIHHVLHMYAYAGRPSKTQYWVRRVLGQLFEPGYTNGYGYPGDEDTGQMSAWYVLNAMGFYSVAPGQGEYIVGSPLFEAVKINLDHGRKWQIVAENNDPTHVYISQASINGSPYDRAYLKHETIMNGGEMNLTMSGQPTAWGESAEAMPSALTTYGETPRYSESWTRHATITGSGENPPAESLRALIDQNSRTKWLTFNPQGAFTIRLPQSKVIDCYTMTSAGDFPQRDPTAWNLFGSNDGISWQLLDRRDSVAWTDRLETRVFYFNSTSSFQYYRMDITANGGASELQLAEFELRSLH